jgi:hypothetical protein
MHNLTDFQLYILIDGVLENQEDGTFKSSDHQQQEKELTKLLTDEMNGRGYIDATDLHNKLGKPFDDENREYH